MKPSRLLLGLLVLSGLVVGLAVAFPVTVPEEYASSQSPDATQPTELPQSEGPSPTQESLAAYTNGTVGVTGGEIDADRTELWAWTQHAMNRNVNVTPTIEIREFPDGLTGSTAGSEETAFRRLLVYDDPDDPPPGEILAYVTAFSPTVNVNEALLPSVKDESAGRSVEGLLVHEYAHVVQFQTPAFRDNQHFGFGSPSDETRAYRAMVEGGAEFVADAYTNESAIERVRALWNAPSTTAAERLGQWPYYRGLVYLDERLDDPANLWGVYRDRPVTTATILRGDAPGDGPPDRSLSLDLPDYHSEVEDRPGAAIAEVALTKEIDPERARNVAAGWRWGALRSIQPDQGAASDGSLRHVWVTEWQNESAADEFETAMTEYLDGRWTKDGEFWDASGGRSFDLVRVDDESLALLVGPESFLAGATVEVEGDEYTIEPATDATAATVGAPSASARVPGTAVVG
ncbi:hypothetical protein GCM10028857_15300 [Salinarchaeum chitinilyticum]